MQNSIVSINGVNLRQIGIQALITERSDQPSMSLGMADRPGGAAASFTTATLSPLSIVLEVTSDTGAGTNAPAFLTAKKLLLRAIDWPLNNGAVTIINELADGTLASCLAYISDIDLSSPASMRIYCTSEDPFFYGDAVSVTYLLGPKSSAVLPVPVPGHVPADLSVTIAPVTQRTAAQATPLFGWRYRRSYSFANSSTRWYNALPVCVDLGDTSAWVTASKALASGNDVRILVNGVEVPRDLTNWNSGRTFAWVVLDCPPGDSVAIDVIYGNALAGSPLSLNGNRYIAIDHDGEPHTLTAGTATTLTDSGAAWTVNRWALGFVQFVSGAFNGRARRITSNTATVLTLSRTLVTSPAVGDKIVIWRSGFAVDGGVASSGSSTTLTDSSQAWNTNEWAGGRVLIIAGTGSGTFANVTSNSATQLVVGSFPVTPDTTSQYRVERQGVWQYYTDQVKHSAPQRGGWYMSARFTKPGTIRFGESVPGGWRRVTMFPNKDDYSQSRVLMFDVGGGDFDAFPILDAKRRRSNNKRYPEERQGDGVSLAVATGINYVRWGYQLKNMGGVAKAVLGCREVGGEDWTSQQEDNATLATLTNRSVTFQALPSSSLAIAMCLGPADDVEIPSDAKATDEAQLRWATELTVWLTPDNFSLTNASGVTEEDVYDTDVLVANGASTLFPRQQLRAGSPKRAMVPIGGKLIADPVLAQVSTEVTVPFFLKTYNIELAQWQEIRKDSYGVSYTVLSPQLLPTNPGENSIPAATAMFTSSPIPIFTVGGVGDVGGITANFTWPADATKPINGYGTTVAGINVTANSGLTGTTAQRWSAADARGFGSGSWFRVLPGVPVSIPYSIIWKTPNVNLAVMLGFAFYKSGPITQISIDTPASVQAVDTTNWNFEGGERIVTPPALAEWVAPALVVRSFGAGTGVINVAQISIGAPLVYVAQTAPGNRTDLTLSAQPRYLF